MALVLKMIEDNYLLKHLFGFLGTYDLFQMSKVSKRYRELIDLPENYGKSIHFKKLSKKYNLGFLFDCVKNYDQALVLYQCVPQMMTNYYIQNSQDRHMRKLFRKIMYRNYTMPKSKLQRVQ